VYSLYCIENKITKQKYIGITSLTPEERWKKHQYAYKTEKKKNDCPKFYNSIRKYGVENFELSVLEQSENSSYIENLEIKYISENSNLLNVSPGGGGMTINSGWKHSPETIEKLKEKTPPMLGKKHSQETIDKMKGDLRRKNSGEKNGMYGKTHTEEYKKKMSEIMSNNNPMKGKKHSPETIEKIRQAALKRNKGTL
jgi:group I intron endonuclease